VYLHLDIQQGEWLRRNCVATFGITAERIAKGEHFDTVCCTAGRVAEWELMSDSLIYIRSIG